MLKNTFLHIPRVNRKMELNLWRSGALSWEDFLKNKDELNLSESKKEYIQNHIRESIEEINKKNYSFFINSIPKSEHWRTYPQFKHNCAFLDIETTGLSKDYSDVTVIGLYDGKESKIFVKGKNLDDFKEEIKKYSLIITFNGICFDVPFLQAKFPEIDFNKFHIDLRYAMRKIGYSGGLKKIEKEIGLNRDENIKDINGFEAVILWKKYLRGDEDALRLLIEYNKADIENLKTLMDFAYDKLREQEFLSYIE